MSLRQVWLTVLEPPAREGRSLLPVVGGASAAGRDITVGGGACLSSRVGGASAAGGDVTGRRDRQAVRGRGLRGQPGRGGSPLSPSAGSAAACLDSGAREGPRRARGPPGGACGPGPRVAGVSPLCRLPSGVYPSGSGVTAVEAPLRPEHRPACFGGRCLGVSFRRRGRRLLQKVFLNRTTRSAGRAAWEAVAAALSAHAQSQPPPGAGTAAGPPAPARRRDAGAAPVPAASRALQPAPLPRGVGARGGALPPAQPARLARAGLCLAI